MRAMKISERERVYFFPQGWTVTLKDVVELAVSDSTHRLKTKDGRLHIIPATWIHISVLGKEWADK